MRVVQIGDVRQKNLSRDLLLEIPVQKIVMDGIRLNGANHAAVRVRFADWAEQTVFLHQTADLLQIHENPKVPGQHHIELFCPFVAVAIPMRFQDSLKIPPILLFSLA